MENAVIGMASDATREVLRRESILVGSRIEQLRLEQMARRTDMLDRIQSWRRGSVTPVTRGTSWSAQVPVGQRRVMNAVVVVRELRGGNLVGLHVFGIGMTL
jgi:hypothetical protein